MKKSVLMIFVLFVSAFDGALYAQTKRQSVQTTSNHDGAKSQLFPVGKTGVQFPKLTYYKNTEILEKVNRKIDEITSEFGCDEDAPRPKSVYKVKTNVEYLTKDIFSIYASASWFCEGSYPTNDSNISLTFDLKTGKLVEFEDLFQHYVQDKAEILKIIFATQLDRSARLVATGKAKEGTCDGDPGLYSLEHFETDLFAYNFSSAGLRVQPLWPHVIEACSERVTVPYIKLKKFAAPDGLLARVIESTR